MLPLLLAAVLAMPIAGDRSIGWNVAVAGARQPKAPVVIDADGEFESAAVAWSAAGDGSVTIRASADGSEWTQPVVANLDLDSTMRSEGAYRSAIVHFGSRMKQIELRFDSASDRVMLTLFPQASKPARDVVRIASYQIGSLNVRSRTDWGCPDGEGAPLWTPAYTTVTHAVVHHTAGANSVANWDAEMRSIWYLHTYTNGWGDIGYNFLIDPDGVIYEGRAGGFSAIGAHFSCKNTNTVGISMLGTYTSVAPTAAAQASLQALLRELCRRFHIDPTATAYHPPTAANLPTVLGHRDGNNLGCTKTECPGDMLYAMLPAIRTAVACTPPAIVTQPGVAAVASGATATLSVQASGSDPLAYQWYLGAVHNTDSPVAGGSESSISLSPSVTTRYWVRVTNACGSVDSDAAVVYVGPQPARRRAAMP